MQTIESLKGKLNCVCIFFATSGSLRFTVLDCLAASKCDSVPLVVGWGLAKWFADTEIIPAVQISLSPILKAFLSFSFISILFHFFFPLYFFQPATFKECELPICSDQAKARPDVT